MPSADLLHYFEYPEHAGQLPSATHQIEVGSKHQGRWVSLDLHIAAEQITDARYRVYGCPYTIALTEYLVQQLKDQPSMTMQQWQWPQSILDDVPQNKHSVLLLLRQLLHLKPTVK